MIKVQTHEMGTHKPTSLPSEIDVELTVRDAEVIAALCTREPGAERDSYALAALRLGVIALRQAAGCVDALVIREEGTRLLQLLRETLTDHSLKCNGAIATSLQQYFDPENGQLPKRIEQLIKRDGELDALLKQHLADDSSTIVQTLAKHVGEQSPLFQLLSPDQADGLLATLTNSLHAALRFQRDQILRQFTLDDKDSALARLVAELTDANGKLRDDLSKDVTEVRKEFSLDNDEGALSRLVKRVEAAQATIADQFSQENEDSALSKMCRLLESVNGTIEASLTLDDDKSALSRLRRELLNILKDQEKTNVEFQKEVRETVAALSAQRKEKARSTRHGDDFQQAVGEFLASNARNHGDIYEDTTITAGRVPRCKKGDYVITLSPESIAAGARVTVEAKEQKGYDVTTALAELAEARRNRNASIGIFVLSSEVAPEGMEELTRYGDDIIAVWDRGDTRSDVVVSAALSLARGLATKQCIESEELAAELNELDDAMRRISKDAKGLSEIIRLSSTVERHGKKIRVRAERLQEDLERQVERLEDHIGRLCVTPTAA